VDLVENLIQACLAHDAVQLREVFAVEGATRDLRLTVGVARIGLPL
jgi:hypothetical protein